MKISRLEEIRQELGLNKSQFAQAMGLNLQYYSNIINEKGTSNLRLEHLEALLINRGVNPAWIITGEGEKYLPINGAERPVITAQMLKDILSEDLPAGWEKTWLSKVFDSTCSAVVSGNPNLTLIEMQNAVLKSVFVLYSQITALIESSATPGDQITLNLEGETFVFPHLGSGKIE